MKKLTALLVFLVILWIPAAATATTVTSADPAHKIEFSFNSEKITYSDGSSAVYDKSYKALIINGTLVKSDVKTVNDRTLVPIRALVEALNGSVDWDGAAQTVTVHKDDKVIVMVIGSKQVIVNGLEQALDVAPNIYNDYTYLPVRFVSETLGAAVSYSTGAYEPNTGNLQNFLIVQGVGGNVIVDQYDPSWTVIGPDEAVNSVRTGINARFAQFKSNYSQLASNATKENALQKTYQTIQNNINSTTVIGTIARYYIIESSNLFLFDKYTGDLYVIGSDSVSNWINRINPNDDAGDLFTKGYFQS